MYFMALFSFSPNHTPKTGTMLEYGLFFGGSEGRVHIFSGRLVPPIESDMHYFQQLSKA